MRRHFHDARLAELGIRVLKLALTYPLVEDTLVEFARSVEGVPWIGLAPFVSEPQLFQNLGDGSWSHSGILAIGRAPLLAST